jgi:hypothetical protein
MQFKTLNKKAGPFEKGPAFLFMLIDQIFS